MFTALLTKSSKFLIYKNGNNTKFVPVYVKFYATKTSKEEKITIGDVTKEIKTPQQPELVPQKYG